MNCSNFRPIPLPRFLIFYLKDVLGEGVVHHVDISRLAEAAEEVDGDGSAQGEVQTAEDAPLHGAQLARRVRVVRDVHKVLDLGCVDFLVLNGRKNKG